MTTLMKEVPMCIAATSSSTVRLSRRAAATSMVAAAALVLSGNRPIGAQDATPEASALLPRDVVLPVEVVQGVVPEIEREIETGANATVMGTPVANRAVTFASVDGVQRIVLSVDQYGSADEASHFFNEALEASKEVPGVTTKAVPDLGDAALIGVVTQGDETHVGGGALFGNLIVNATLQSFDGTDENKNRVADLIRKQAEHAAEALGSTASATSAG